MHPSAALTFDVNSCRQSEGRQRFGDKGVFRRGEVKVGGGVCKICGISPPNGSLNNVWTNS